jgi:hypothetical protein
MNTAYLVWLVIVAVSFKYIVLLMLSYFIIFIKVSKAGAQLCNMKSNNSGKKL